MIVLDTSAVLAILLDEPERRAFNEAIVAAGRSLLSAASLLESTIVIETKRGEVGGRELDLWLHRAGVEVAGVDGNQLELARRAWRRFGKDRHPAALNFGDCFSYALSVHGGAPLLFKGDDFAKTDVAVAPAG